MAAKNNSDVSQVNGEQFKTPDLKRKRHISPFNDSTNKLCVTPNQKKAKTMTIPPSPFLKRLGYGTGVSVYLMDRPATPGGAKSPWAIKKLPAHKGGKNKSSFYKTFEERILYEAKILKSLNHRNIVGYRDTLRGADGALCLCLESGERSLNDLIEVRRDEGQGPFPPNRIHQVVHGVCHALTYLHEEKNLLHGDLKSHNILVKGEFEEIKLCDFGVCLKLKEDLQGLADDNACYVGTAAWSSREVLEDEMITDRADIYSLGCVIYEMLSLNVPHLPPLDEDSSLEASFNEEEFLDAQGSVPQLPDVHFDESYNNYIALMTICCREEAAKRPSAKEICETLELLAQNSVADT